VCVCVCRKTISVCVCAHKKTMCVCDSEGNDDLSDNILENKAKP
jgi:hypothetical protein